MSDSDNFISDEDETTGKPAVKKKKYEQKFLNSWLTEPLFAPWLEKREDVPYCKLCKCSLSCAKTTLKRHVENKKHKDLYKVKEQVSAPNTSMLGARANPARIEIKLCSFIAEKNLPISLVEELVPLLRDLFPSDPALRQVKLGKQKSTNIIRQVLGFHAMKECVSKLRENKFSLIIDETTDKSTTSQLAILGVYFNEETFKLEIIVIDLVPLTDGAATTIYNAVIDSLSERGVPMKNVIGFCADTCNVMFGVDQMFLPFNSSVQFTCIESFPQNCRRPVQKHILSF